jgi:glutamate dehydrogenase (NAD(P)+)
MATAISLEKETNPWEAQAARFDEAARKLNLDEGMCKVLRHPTRELILHIPVQMDDPDRVLRVPRAALDRARPLQGRHSLCAGRHAGRGTRPGGLDDLEVRGGEHPSAGAGAASSATHGLSWELERITRRYTAEILDYIGPERDVPAPDMNTNEQTMAWIMDTYSIHSALTTAVVTGKPVDLGGSRQRLRTRGRAVADQAPCFGRKREGRVIIGVRQRGRPGGAAVRGRATKSSAWTCLGVLNARAGHSALPILRRPRPSGLCGRQHRNLEILEQDYDVLLPATESVITSRNAHKIKARILSEGANSPTSAPADDILFDRGVFVIPDILANGGGVTVSYFEWVQDRQGYFWPEAMVNERLEHIMVAAFDSVVRYRAGQQPHRRLYAGIDRVAFSVRLRGIYA